MNTKALFLSKLALCLVALSPAIVSAAPPSTSPYYTDTTNSYVQDETTQAMSSLNGILCYIHAMAPAEMVNLGNYVALVDQKACSPNDTGGSSGGANSGADYLPVIVNSSRVDNNSPMIAKIWIDLPAYGSRSLVYLSATQAPNPPTDPFGRFRMDYCSTTTTGSTCLGGGFIDSTANGLAYYETYSGNGGTNTLKLKLNATTGSTVGSGALEQTYTGSFGQPSFAFAFAYDANYFHRSNGTSAGDLCFDRSAANAAESVWSYGLYNPATGVRLERNSGFTIEYTDLSTQTTMTGYVGYWGLSAQTAIDTSKPVIQVTYDGTSATKTPYTLMQTGGKLIKNTQVTRTLLKLDKIKFQFWASASVPGVSVPATPPTLTSGNYYEVYWDNANTTFWISGQRDPNTYNIVPYAQTVALSVANMKLAAPYGIYGSSNMLGGSFTVASNVMSTLGPNTQVQSRAQDVVYPSEFAALGGMMCINNCPTAADIALSNAAPTVAPVSPFDSTTIGWAYSTGKALYNYTLNAATGNLMDAAATPAAVTSVATTGNNSSGIYSGRMVATSDIGLLNAAVLARTGLAAANNYTQADIDALPAYYEWQTGPNAWSQLAILKDSAGAPVRFEAPLDVTFVVPNTGAADVAKYGTAAGATITLQYGGFGNLWGIPSSCVDSATNLPCTFGVGGTSATSQRWTPAFTIPSTLDSIVSVPYTQGTAVAGTTYLVKALLKEVRLANVPLSTCTNAGLSVPNIANVTLPVFDPATATTASSIGAMPAFNPQPAPRVIQGVKKY
jgi:hypothetical protein